MEKADLEAGLHSLQKSLGQIKALLAWDELRIAESKPEQPLAFTMADSVETDLQNEYSFFVATSVQVRNLLKDGSSAIPQEQRERLGHQLVKIERQLCRIDLNRRRCIR
jgi:hypothetical protein